MITLFAVVAELLNNLLGVEPPMMHSLSFSPLNAFLRSGYHLPTPFPFNSFCPLPVALYIPSLSLFSRVFSCILHERYERVLSLVEIAWQLCVADFILCFPGENSVLEAICVCGHHTTSHTAVIAWNDGQLNWQGVKLGLLLWSVFKIMFSLTLPSMDSLEWKNIYLTTPQHFIPLIASESLSFRGCQTVTL